MGFLIAILIKLAILGTLAAIIFIYDAINKWTERSRREKIWNSKRNSQPRQSQISSQSSQVGTETSTGQDKPQQKFTVHLWLPKNKTHTQPFWDEASGHAAATIAGRYFSFNSRNKGDIQNESIREDDRYHRKYGNERVDIDLPIAQNLYPYVLKYYGSGAGYIGLGSSARDLPATNCCLDIAVLIESAVLPYLLELFGDSNKNTYWLNVDGSKPEQVRYHILKRFYYKYNVWEPKGTTLGSLKYSDEEALLQHWSLFKLYYCALVHEHGRNSARRHFRRDGKDVRPDDIPWYPLRLYHYAQFAKALSEEFERVDVPVPSTRSKQFLIADNDGKKEEEQKYSFKVHVWLPANHTYGLISGSPGHAAVTIADNYFSFSREGNKILGRKNKWKEFDEDEAHHSKRGNKREKDIELPLSQELYPYVLNQCEPEANYKGMIDINYDFFKYNCTSVAAVFIRSSLLPYLMEILESHNANISWINNDDYYTKDISCYRILKRFYYRYNSLEDKNVYDTLRAANVARRTTIARHADAPKMIKALRYSDEEAIINNWTLYWLWYISLVQKHGVLGAQKIEAKNYTAQKMSIPDDIQWSPSRLKHYAWFAKALMEKVPNEYVEVPPLYKTKWKNGELLHREVRSVESFTQWFKKQKKKQKQIFTG